MIADLKTALLCSGVTLPESMRTGRKGGAGPAGGRYIRVKDTVVNVPIYGAALQSPFSVKREGDKFILENDKKYEVTIIEDPQFYQLKTDDGIPYKKIALLHGIDCLATTVYQKCIWWRGAPCSFCGIELSLRDGTTLEQKTPEQLRIVAEAAVKEGATHATLTTGTPNEVDKGTFILAESAAALKEIVPAHVQIEPVARTYLEFLKSAGAATIGIHIETLDEDLFRMICPSKNFFHFEPAWREAVDIFGDNQVSSFVLVGLDEDTTEMAAGIDKMVQIGVIPYIVPFRPLPKTLLANHPFPSFKTVKKFSVLAAEKMKEYGIDPFKNKAGCVRCGACSPVKEYLMTL